MTSEISVVGPYMVGRTLGTGSTGKVKLGFHQDTGEKVAIKIVNKDFLLERPSMRRKVEREIAVMKLINFDTVLKLLDVYETSKYLFLVTEFVEGGELFDYLVRKGSLEPMEALQFFQQLITGMEYCHNVLICHRDLKPENLLLDASGDLKIADFGMAALMKKGALLKTSCGSPHYASPEVVMGVRYDGRAADVWSCGVILFALLTGKLPFDDDNIRRLLGKVKSGVFAMPQFLAKEIKDLIWRMLMVDPAKRISIAEIKNHEWYRSNQFVNTIKLQPLNTLDDSPLPSADAVDEELLRSLACLGWGTKRQILQSLLVKERNLEKVFYRLLEKRKAESIAAIGLEEASPSGGGDGADGADVAIKRPAVDIDEESRSESFSSETSEAETSVQSESSSHAPDNNKPEKSTASTSSAAKDEKDAAGRNRAGSSFTRMKLHTEGDKVASSSPSVAKRSFFSSFLGGSSANLKKTVYRTAPRSGGFGMHSEKTMPAIVTELNRALGVLNCKSKTAGDQMSIRSKYTEPESKTSCTFKVEITQVGGLSDNPVQFVGFARKSGNKDAFRIFCEEIAKECHL